MVTAESSRKSQFLTGSGEMGARISEFDWTRTLLGPIEYWPQCLKLSLNLILGSKHPMWIGWGREMTFLCNDACADILGEVLGPAKRASALGLPVSKAWAEIGDAFGETAEKVLETGDAASIEHARVSIRRGDLIEEVLCSFSWSAIRDESGEVRGLFCPWTSIRPAATADPPGRTVTEVLESITDGYTGVFTDGSERLAPISGQTGIAFDSARLLEKAERESEQRFREMVDALPAAIYTTDAEGRLTHFNPAAVRFSGRTPQLGTDQWCVTWKLFNADGTPLPHDQCPMAAALKGGESWEPGSPPPECIAEQPDGTRKWFSPYPTPLRNSEGTIIGGVNMLVDITARKDAEDARRRSDERFRGVFESSAIGVAILMLDGGFLEANSAFCAITGYSEEELRSLSCVSLTHPDDRAETKKLLGSLLQGEIPAFAVESRYIAKGGGAIWVKNSVSLMRDSGGCPEHIIALSEDITAGKQVEAALRESEERFRAIVETTPECVKLVAPDGVLLHMNTAGIAMLGATSADEVLGTDVTKLLAPEFRDAFREFNQRICSGERATLEFDIVTLRGDRRHMETHAAPLRRPDGSTAQLAVTSDITERKQREGAAMLLGAIVDSSDDAIISKDLNGIITSWNKSAERVFGYTASEVIGKSITILIPPDRLDEEPEILRKLRSGQRVDHFETIRRRKDGTLLDISLTISPVRNSNGNVIGASKIARDISERKRTEREQKRVEDELRRANQDLEQFAYSASHDLQEPLRGVKIYSELLAARYGDKFDAQGQEFLAYLCNGASRMQMLLRDLLAYTQVTKLGIPEQAVDANAALLETLDNLKGAIMESGAGITSDPLPALRVHNAHLKQLFQNLIGNAIKYRSRERRPAVHIAAEKQGEYWMVSVKDNGIGIDPEYKERIFGLFKRLHTSDEYPGTGIGLAICRRIVDRYHGRIWVESVPEQGSTFTFCLPI